MMQTCIQSIYSLLLALKTNEKDNESLADNGYTALTDNV